ncbi:MAG: MerR family transcriptional regulator [Thermotogae bacterium]|nr:MerR family transcriptional regulator [Thermotogota bacterium]
MKRRSYLDRASKRLYYSLAEVEQITGLSRRRIYALEEMGFIRTRQRNGRRLYAREDLEKLLDFQLLLQEYPPEVIVRSYDELKLLAKLKRYRNTLTKVRNRIRRFFKENGYEP